MAAGVSLSEDCERTASFLFMVEGVCCLFTLCPIRMTVCPGLCLNIALNFASEWIATHNHDYLVNFPLNAQLYTPE